MVDSAVRRLATAGAPEGVGDALKAAAVNAVDDRIDSRELCVRLEGVLLSQEDAVAAAWAPGRAAGDLVRAHARTRGAWGCGGGRYVLAAACIPCVRVWLAGSGAAARAPPSFAARSLTVQCACRQPPLRCS